MSLDDQQHVVWLLDYVAGNIRSLVNAIERTGFSVRWIRSPQDLQKADRVIFPGVGHFQHCLAGLEEGGYVEPLKRYIASGKPFMGICVGMQALFEGSDESLHQSGLGLVKGRLARFHEKTKSVPQIGWNSASIVSGESVYGLCRHSKYYYVHSYAAPYRREDWPGWYVATTTYGDEEYIGAIAKQNILATQFHPEKSGVAGLRVLEAFLNDKFLAAETGQALALPTGLTKRVIACLDVRSNDRGDLVVTKGDQYDVRDKDGVRNLGKPVELAKRYYAGGADEITFLNITSFRNNALKDTPMLEVLRLTSKQVFVPLTIGGGIRDVIDPDGTKYTALEVAREYFASGADKVSIGSDAVMAAEEYGANGETLTGKTAIESIARAYGSQAVVVSVDPKRVYVADPEDTPHHTLRTELLGPHGENYCWYQCTVSGGRAARDLDVHQLVTAVAAMGAGEILLNCIDRDGAKSGFDLELIRDVKHSVSIPVIASSGAGSPEHFAQVFRETSVDAALGAGMFHRGEYSVWDVKSQLLKEGILVRDERMEEESI